MFSFFLEIIQPSVERGELKHRQYAKSPTNTNLDTHAMTAILTQRQRWNIKVLMALVLLAVYHSSLRIRTYLLWASLVPPSLLPWREIYDKGDSLSFCCVTGLMQEAFKCLLYIVILHRMGCWGFCYVIWVAR